MIRIEGTDRRPLGLEHLSADLAIVGGGLAGTCCAITAARTGLRVVLVQDRPVLGGNASSEVRLWILGATSHMGNNNRWAREGGVVDEILVENLYRNPEGNPYILDTILLEKVVEEPNIRLLLNTAVHDLEKANGDTIRSVRAFCSPNGTAYEVSAPLFCDASGDGIVGFLAGAAFRMGAEASSEFGEAFAPANANAEMLGNTLYFYSKDTGRPVRFVLPSFALKDITAVPRWRDFKAGDCGCRLWWIEYGGALDIVREAEAIKWELWKVVYGVWNHIKNSGQFPEAETLTLEWVGAIPGKRESRRFEGDYMLTQRDVVEQREHPDTVSYGGWAIDLHPAAGVYSPEAGCAQWHAKGVYGIPYRCLYSRNIRNLFLAGRLISVSHVAFGSTRVMATCAHGGQAVAHAAALCRRDKVDPRAIESPELMAQLQRNLLRSGQYIPGVALVDPADLAGQATLSASSRLRLRELKPNGEALKLDDSWAMLLPAQPGTVPSFEITVDVTASTTLHAELRVSQKPTNHTPDNVLQALDLPLPAGKGQTVSLPFAAAIHGNRYVFLCLLANPDVSVWLSDQRLTGVLALTHRANHAVAKSARQEPPTGSGLEAFEFWIPQRRPGGKNFALRIDPPLDLFGPENLANGVDRPTRQPNAWVADFTDCRPTLTLAWADPKTLVRVELVFDTDYDHPLESVQMGHPERVMPFCVPEVVIHDGRTGNRAGRSTDGAVSQGQNSAPGSSVLEPRAEVVCAPEALGPVLATVKNNHQSRRSVCFDLPVTTDRLVVCLTPPPGGAPATLFAVRCYSK